MGGLPVKLSQTLTITQRTNLDITSSGAFHAYKGRLAHHSEYFVRAFSIGAW
jgi:hypothetical protein